MADSGGPNYHHLLALGHKKITQADLKKAFGTVLFDEIFDWVYNGLTKFTLEKWVILWSFQRTGLARAETYKYN